MCGRFTLETPIPELARLFDAALPDELADLPARYNIAPTQEIAIVRNRARSPAERPPSPGGGGERPRRELALLRWGLLPGWVQDPDDWPTLINARAETLHTKPAFEDAFRFRRCLVPADGFFEWRREGRGKQPYFVRTSSEGPMAFAGLWERRVGDQETVESCTIATTEANELLKPIHDRMPVILERETWARWLDPGLRTYDELADLLQPFPSDRLLAYRVSRAVNRADAEGPTCIEPLEGSEPWRGEMPPEAPGASGTTATGAEKPGVREPRTEGPRREEGPGVGESGGDHEEEPAAGQLDLF